MMKMKCNIEGCEKEGKERKIRYVFKLTMQSREENELDFRDYGVLCKDHFIDALKDHILELLIKIDNMEWDIAELGG